MNRTVVIVCSLVLLLTGCMSKVSSGPIGGSNDSGTSMEAVVRSISLRDGKISSILVLDNENMEYVFHLSDKVDFKDEKKLKTGDKIKVEHKGEFRESYPAQGTAIRISILENRVNQVIDSKSYSMIPIRASYSETYYQKSENSLGIISAVIDNKEKYDSLMEQLGFESENKVNLRAKYDKTFFQTQKLILIAKFTSSTPSYSISSLTKRDGKVTVQMKERTSEVQTDDILIKGFLIEVDSSIMTGNTALSVEYIQEMITK